jgi:hypothetical protein
MGFIEGGCMQYGFTDYLFLIVLCLGGAFLAEKLWLEKYFNKVPRKAGNFKRFKTSRIPLSRLEWERINALALAQNRTTRALLADITRDYLTHHAGGR